VPLCEQRENGTGGETTHVALFYLMEKRLETLEGLFFRTLEPFLY
jgi:hypothetical protein